MRPELESLMWKPCSVVAGFLFGAVTAAASFAQGNIISPDDTERSPFAYSLRHTSLDEAREYWSQNGMEILMSGHLALGTGKGQDGQSGVVAEKVTLVDVSGVDFEGISIARFGFYENRLYRIQARLRPALLKSESKSDHLYTDDQMKELEARLKRKYGKPKATQRTMYAGKGQEDDVMVWSVNGGTLIFTSNKRTGNLLLTNEETEVEIKKYIKAYCKTVNTKDRIVCW